MCRRCRYTSSVILAALVAASPASKVGAEIVLSSERIATGLSRQLGGFERHVRCRLAGHGSLGHRCRGLDCALSQLPQRAGRYCSAL